MPIVTGLTKRLPIPHEKGQWIIIRQLSWRQKEKASEAKTDSVLAWAKTMGAELMREIQSAASRPATLDPADSYDKALVLRFGITDWSYETPLSPDAIDELDDVTAAWAVGEILAFSGPASEEEAKND